MKQDKCEFGATEITFSGLTKDGIRLDPEKVTAIKNIPTQENKANLQKFLGMISYLSKSIPYLYTETDALRKRLTKDESLKLNTMHLLDSFVTINGLKLYTNLVLKPHVKKTFMGENFFSSHKSPNRILKTPIHKAGPRGKQFMTLLHNYGN